MNKLVQISDKDGTNYYIAGPERFVKRVIIDMDQTMPDLECREIDQEHPLNDLVGRLQ